MLLFVFFSILLFRAEWARGQTTIASQGFESSGNTWSYTPSGTGGGLGTNPCSGTGSYQATNNTVATAATLTFNAVDISLYKNVKITAKITAIGTTNNGLDAGDNATFSASINGAAYPVQH